MDFYGHPAACVDIRQAADALQAAATLSFESDTPTDGCVGAGMHCEQQYTWLPRAHDTQRFLVP